MRILILGGDGFCGWPASLHPSALGHGLAIVDDLSRRKIDVELECDSLTAIRSMGERRRAWKEISGTEIALHNFNEARKYQRPLDPLNDWHPHTVAHFSEQRAARYSMKE